MTTSETDMTFNCFRCLKIFETAQSPGVGVLYLNIFTTRDLKINRFTLSWCRGSAREQLSSLSWLRNLSPLPTMLVGPTVFNLLSFILLICITNAILVNISIDDRYGDLTTGQRPVYQPDNIWTHSPCDADVYCITSPNTTLAFDQTWSAAFYAPGHGSVFITFPFTGQTLFTVLVVS
jgi:hypothetical protein